MYKKLEILGSGSREEIEPQAALTRQKTQEGLGRMRFPRITLSLASLALALTSCVTSRSGSTSGKMTKNSSKTVQRPQPLPKEGQKTEAQQAPSATQPPREELNALLTRLSDQSLAASEEDLRAAGKLHPAPQGSLEEAVFITAQLRLLKQELERTGSFQSRDLYPSGSESGSTSKSSLSLEKFFQELDINLPQTLTQNSSLQDVNTFKMVQQLQNSTQNSEGFDAQMVALIKQQAQKWPELLTTGEAAPAESAAASPVEAAGQIAADTPTSTEPNQVGEAGKANATDLKRSDAILLQAQKAADKGDFKQAIEMTSRIDNQDPLSEQAREKTRVFSNRAVQDLRQRAALAFQNALPMSDSRAKEAYLTQAKNLLETALREYPAADQLDTVKENLAVIKRDLDSIAKETAVESAAKNQ